MSALPDDLWLGILDMGISTAGGLTYRDLCCLAITSRRFNRLSQHPSLWVNLLAFDFPEPVPSFSSSSSASVPTSKSLYKTRFEKDKAKKQSEWKRAVLRAESQVAVCSSKLKDLEFSLVREGERLKTALAELGNLERVRRASVALNVWQPQVIHGSQKQIVEQCTVPMESRLSTLKMEVRVCKQQIETFRKAYDAQKQKLIKYNEALKSLKYHPLEDHMDPAINDSKKQKKFKSDGTN